MAENFDPMNLEFCLNGCFWDLNTGCVLKLGEDFQVLHAILGQVKLNQKEIAELYGTPPTKKFDMVKTDL